MAGRRDQPEQHAGRVVDGELHACGASSEHLATGSEPADDGWLPVDPPPTMHRPARLAGRGEEVRAPRDRARGHLGASTAATTTKLGRKIGAVATSAFGTPWST